VRGGRRAFVTSVKGSGNLGSWPAAGGETGIAAGDAICRKVAADAGVALADSFKAWLSTATTDARTRFTDGPWVRMDGLLLAESLAELTAGLLRTAIDRDEAGTPLVNGVWTGTSSEGFDVGSTDCDGWTDGFAAFGALGVSNESSDAWTHDSESGCVNPRNLYCLSDATPALLFADGFDSGSARFWSASTH
jgi:hypothetical protein